MSTSEVSNGLVLPYAAMTLAGRGGAAAALLMTFMAATSTMSAQVIAVSSILSFDVYREYFNKSATDKQIIRWSHIGVIFFAAFSAGFSTMLHYVGIGLQWTLYMLGKRSHSEVHAPITNPRRRGYVPRYLPHDLHSPLASAKQSRSHFRSNPRHGNRTSRLAGNSVQVGWQCIRFGNRPSPPLRIRHCCFCLLVHPVLDNNHALQTAELRLE